MLSRSRNKPSGNEKLYDEVTEDLKKLYLTIQLGGSITESELMKNLKKYPLHISKVAERFFTGIVETAVKRNNKTAKKAFLDAASDDYKFTQNLIEEIGSDDRDVLFNFSLALMSLQKYEDAIKTFNKILEKNPNDVVAKRMLANVYLKMNEKKTATHLLEELIKKAPAFTKAYYDLASIYLADGNIPTAEKYITTALDINYRDASLWVLHAKIMIEKGDFSNALSSLQQAVLLNPDNYETWKLLGFVYEHLNDIEKSRRAYNKAVLLAKNNTKALEDLADFHKEHGHLSEAESIYSLILEQKPEIFTVWNKLGNIYLLKKNYTKAMEAFNKSLELQEENNIGAFIGLAKINYAQKNYNATLIYINKILAHQPKNITANILLAGILAEREDYPSAIKTLKKLIFTYPNTPKPWMSLGKLYFKMGEFLKARFAFKKAYELGEKSLALHFYLGNTYLRLKKAKKAYENLRIVYSHKKDNLRLAYILGVLCKKISYYNDAINYLNDALKLAEENKKEEIEKNILYRLLALYMKTKQFDNAIETAQRLLNLDPNNIDALILFSKALLYKSEARKAVDILLAALETHPGNPRILFAIGEIFYKVKLYHKALPYLKEAYKLSTDVNVGLVKYIGLCYYKLNKYREAILYLEEYLNYINFRDRPISEVLCICRFKLGYYNKAETCLKKLVQKDKRNSKIPFYLGILMIKRRKFVEAEKYFNLAIQRKKNFYRAYELLSYVLRKQGRNTEAREVKEKLKKIRAARRKSAKLSKTS